MVETDPTGGKPLAEVLPTPEPRGRSKHTICGFCDCKLDADGDIVTMGKRAREFRDMTENDQIRLRRIAELESQVSELQKELETRKAEPEPPVEKKDRRASDFEFHL